jgi:hypothetical protein
MSALMPDITPRIQIDHTFSDLLLSRLQPDLAIFLTFGQVCQRLY